MGFNDATAVPLPGLAPVLVVSDQTVGPLPRGVAYSGYTGLAPGSYALPTSWMAQGGLWSASGGERATTAYQFFQPGGWETRSAASFEDGNAWVLPAVAGALLLLGAI